ncbi:hypothetical protein CHMI_01082 [Cellulomonas hominis]|nr:hypothetical protein CHMI_01082 [Cellulomonas hominis]
MTATSCSRTPARNAASPSRSSARSSEWLGHRMSAVRGTSRSRASTASTNTPYSTISETCSSRPTAVAHGRPVACSTRDSIRRTTAGSHAQGQQM